MGTFGGRMLRDIRWNSIGLFLLALFLGFAPTSATADDASIKIQDIKDLPTLVSKFPVCPTSEIKAVENSTDEKGAITHTAVYSSKGAGKADKLVKYAIVGCAIQKKGITPTGNSLSWKAFQKGVEAAQDHCEKTLNGKFIMPKSYKSSMDAPEGSFDSQANDPEPYWIVRTRFDMPFFSLQAAEKTIEEIDYVALHKYEFSFQCENVQN